MTLLEKYLLHLTYYDRPVYREILKVIQENPKCSQIQIVKIFEQQSIGHVNHKVVGRKIKKMKKDGLVEYVPNWEDMRTNFMRVTELGSILLNN